MLSCVYFSKAQKENSKTINKNCTVTIASKESAEIEIGENTHPYGGTFQFIISKNAKSKEIFTTDILKIIEDNRTESEEKIIILSPNTKVWILSKNQINNPDFIPLINLYSIEK